MRRDLEGRWLGEHLWSCIACTTRNPAEDVYCTNCSRGYRPPITARHSLDADTLRMAADALQRPRFYRSPEIYNLAHALDVEARAIEEGRTIPAPPADVREAIRVIVAYAWQVEARDFEENHAPEETGTGHVFEFLRLVDGWLEGETSQT